MSAAESAPSVAVCNLPSRRVLIPQDPRTEITETLTAGSFLAELSQQGSQLVDDIVALHRILVESIEAGAGFVAPEIHLIFVRRFADQSEFCHERPGATIRTTGHADHQFF